MATNTVLFLLIHHHHHHHHVSTVYMHASCSTIIATITS